MKQRWMRRVAVILVLCLLFNDNLTSVFLKTQAVEQDASVALFDVSGNDAVSSGVSGNEGGFSEDEESLSDNDLLGMMQTFSLTRASGIQLPDTEEEYTAAVNSGTRTFYISTKQDFLNAQTFCEIDGFAGINLIVASPEVGSGGIWDMASIDGFEGIGLTTPFQGTLTCSYENGNGIQFKIDKPIIVNMGDGASMTQMDIVCNGSVSAIAQNISGAVTLSDLWIRGTIGSGSGTVGLFASTIESDSGVTISDSKLAGALTISGAVAGGYAGTAGDNVTITWNSSADFNDFGNVKVTGTESAGGCFGNLTGSFTFDVSTQEYYPILVTGTAGYYGQVAGNFTTADSGSGTLTITGGNTLTVNLAGAGGCGGLVGYLKNAANIVIPDNGLTIAGSMSGEADNCGGVAGKVSGSSKRAALELTGYTIEVVVDGNWNVGGLIGYAGWGKYIIGDVSVGKVEGGVTGGLIGGMESAAVELQKGITISSAPTGWKYFGLLIGERRKNCLIYLSEPGLIENTVTTSVTGLEEIGAGGCVFRNPKTSGNALIGNGTLDRVGKVNYTVSKSGDWYQLTSAADFECLAVVLTTQGTYGREAFSSAAYADLVAGKYNVTNDVDISYLNTGIVTLNHQYTDTDDGETGEEYAFSGSFVGTGSGVTITQNSSLKQDWLGLFSTLTGSNSFSNLTFAGNVTNAKGVGSIAYQTFGTGLTLENITMQKAFYGCTGNIGGVLALENGAEEFKLTVDEIVLASTIEAGTVDTYSGFITKMDLADISINDVTLGGSMTGTGTGTVGGFLGREWTLIGGKIANVSVQSDTIYETTGKFGGLVSTLTSHNAEQERVVFDTITLDGLTVNTTWDQTYCGLLIQDARQLVVEVIDYDSTGCVVNKPGSFFDEIAGRIKDTSGFSASAGIISLHRSDVDYPDWHYENKVDSLKSKPNSYGLYFYDVFQILENTDGTPKDAAVIEKVSSQCYVDTPEKLLVWDLVQLADKNNLPYLTKYYADGAEPNQYWNKYTLSGDLDMSNISFYPMPKIQNATYTGVNNAKITFGATAEMASWALSNVDATSQHYGLQAGLIHINSESINTIIIEDLALSGQIANLGNISGGLVLGENGLNGEVTLSNITLDNLWVCNYNKEEGVGLFISRIPNNMVTLQNIQMINYPKSSETKAASALIGSAGSDAATALVLRFSQMKIADDVDGGKEHNGDVLAHASFLYSYDYTDDAEINTGSGIYLFSEADATENDIVTYGNELTGDTEFSDTSNGVLSTMKIASTDYKPYVYTTEKKIEVNPKTGDILKGCGTYEDPYIIEDAKQFLTLYRYINEKGTAGNYQYESFYSSGNGWKIIKPGTDSEFCADKHVVTWNSETSTYEGSEEHIADVMTFGDEGFPSPEELSRAYYQLGANIDLSAVGGDTYKSIADEFIGFGTDTRPFVGVWHGAGYTITLPDKTGKTYSNYGFIQYAQGAVVKDITIKMPGTDLTTAPTVTNSAGSVIATVLGGDNIIDNVTIEMALNVADENVPAGGYVGVVKKGGLILRNVTSLDLSSCEFNLNYSATGVLGAIVGKVEDGYIVHEGSGFDSYIWQGITAVNGYSAVPNYSILNADALKKSNLSLTMAEDGTNCTLTFSIPDAAGLQIMSMALNADALNVRPNGHWSYGNSGYTEKARCRKAQYNTIGTTTQTADYTAAAQYDNVMGYSSNANYTYAYPYLYDFMGITGDDYLTYLRWEEYSVLNTTNELDLGNVYRSTWELAEDTEYDMTQFGNAFRGIGALYQLNEYYSGTFHGTFDGNNSSVHYDMTRNVLTTETFVTSIGRVGLFNTIWGGASDTTEIKDLKLSGTLSGSGQGRSCAGGLVSYLIGGNYTIENVGVAAGASLMAKDYINCAGGLIGEISTASEYETNVAITGCYVNGTEGALNAITCSSNAGGIVGNVNTTSLVISDSKVDYLQISSGSGYVGGFIGFINGGTIQILGTEDMPSIVLNSTITGRYSGGFIGRNDATEMNVAYVECVDSTIGTVYNVESVGGIIGYNYRNATISHGTCSGLVLGAYANAGGIVGQNAGSNRTTAISDMTVSDIKIEEFNAYNGSPEGLGGVVGRNEHYLMLENVQVVGTNDGDCQIKGTAQARTAHQGVGGLVGYHLYAQNTVTLKNCTVDTVQISTSMSSTGGQNIAAGGLVGYAASPVVIDSTGSCTCINLKITAPLASNITTDAVMAAGGGFGYVSYQDSSMYGSVNCGTDDDAYTALTIVGNNVSGKNAGGLIGRSELAAFNLKGIQITDNTVTSDEMAGGFVGYLKPYYSAMPISLGEAEGKEGYTHAENFTLQKNTIIAKSVGGLIGAYEADTTLEASIFDVSLINNVIAAEISADVVTENPAVGGLIGRTISNSSTGTAPLHCDGIFMQNTNRIGVKQSSSGTVQLVQTDGSTYQLADVAMPAASTDIATDYSAIDALEQEFSCFVGVFVGVWEATNIQMYITDSQEANGRFVFPVLASNPPVVDVGRNSEQSLDAYRSYCHIIYGAENSVASSESQHLADMKTQIDATKSKYTGAESYTELLTGLRASKAAMDLFEMSYQDGYQFPGTELVIEFPMLVYRVQNGTLQEVLENVTDVMTNVAGISASDMQILSIQCTPKLYDGASFTIGTKASISATVTEGITTYTMVGYDGVTDNQLSYTELTFTYDNSGRVETFVVPVFVEEPILYSVHSKIMEGKVSDVSIIKANGTSEDSNSIIMANDSNYTLLLEYTYGEARKQMVEGVATDKVFYLKQNNEIKAWPNGTQLLLIDVTGGNKPYYYTVQGNEVKTIKFTDFKDSSGQNAYENPSIKSLPDEVDAGQEYYTDLGNHQLTNTAVERYLLTVLSNDNDLDSKLYSFHAGLSIDDESLASRFQLEEEHKEETVWNITAIPGLTVSLINKGSDTDISGSISKTDGIIIKASFALQAQDIYWVERGKAGAAVIDSSNSSKYLEVAFYLRDINGNRVALPNGTNFSYKLGDGSYSGNRVIADNSIVYYYKDIRTQFSIADSEYLISDISQNTIVPIEYVLDFSGADLTTVLDDSYVGWIELLRTGNKDYPMGNGNDVDSHFEPIDANAMQELGFALRADNMESLAINTYPEPATQNTITGHIMFDFSENLELAGSGAGKDLVLEKWASLDYEVTYQLYKKTDSGYVAYTGDDIIIEATDQTGLVHIQSVENGEENAGLKVIYNFTANQIETGNGEVPVEGVLSFPCQITQKTADLVQETDSLTNYRLEATLAIKEAGVTEEVSEKTTDFFVYTVTKLKFDL